MQKFRTGFTVLVLALAFGCPARASQIANHIRIAYKAMDDPRTPPLIREILSKNLESYAAGAAGPDILTNVTGQHSALAELPHYSRTSNLITNMLWLLSQGKDPNTESYLAYVLGWLTHGYQDIFEHAVVDRYGGYYQIKENRPWHKQLEMFETAHVFAIAGYNPDRPYVAKREWFPSMLLKSAFQLTYGSADLSKVVGFDPTQSIGHMFDSGVLHTEAYLMQFFTENLQAATKQHLYGPGIETVQAFVGAVPIYSDYEATMKPLWLAVDYFGYRNPAVPEEGLQVDLTYLMNDNKFKVSYISDWYASNDKSVEAIVGSFNRIASSVHRVGNQIVIDSDIQTGMPNFDWDSGRPEGQPDADLRAIQLKPVDELAVVWQIYDGSRQVAQGIEKIPNADVSGTHQFTIPLSSDLMPLSRERELQWKGALRMVSKNVDLHPDGYVTAFRFDVSENGTKLVEAVKRPVEASVTKSFRQASPLVKATEPGSLTPEIKVVEDLLAKLREAAGRSAALAAQAGMLAGLARGKATEADAALNIFDQSITRYQSDLAALRAQHARLQPEAAEIAGLASRAIAAARETSAAIEQAHQAEVEACKKMWEAGRTTTQGERDTLVAQAQQAASRSAAFAQTAQAKYQEAANALSRIRQIQLDCADFTNEQRAISGQVQNLTQMLETPAALLQEARAKFAELQQVMAQLQSVVAEGSALCSDAVRRIDALPPAYAPWKKDAASLYGQIQANAQKAQGLPANITPAIESVEKDLFAARAVLQSVASGFTELKAPQLDESLIRDAGSWVDTAELYAGSADISAKNAARCAGNPPPPVSENAPDWDNAANSASTTVSTEPDWDTAANQGTSTTAGKLPPAEPEPGPSQLPPPGQEEPEPDQNGSDNDAGREAAKTLTNVLIDIWNRSVNKGNPGGGNPAPEQQGGTQNSGGCMITGDARSVWQTNTWYLFKNTQYGGEVYTVMPGASENVSSASPEALSRIYGVRVGTYSTSAAAIQAAGSYCPNPTMQNVIQ